MREAQDMHNAPSRGMDQARLPRSIPCRGNVHVAARAAGLLGAVGLLSLLVLRSCASQPVGAGVYRGLNIFGPWQNGEANQPWAFPDASELDYFKAKGLTTFSVHLLWENLQPRLFGPFESTYLAAVDAFVASCKARGERLSFTFINLGVYPAPAGNAIGSPQVLAAGLLDLWTRMATHYRDEPTVWAYDLMNEPFSDSEWITYAHGEINTICAVDSTKPIMAMPRDESANTWSIAFPGFDDAANKLWYEAHVYFDRGSNGFYRGTYDEEGAYPLIGVDRARPFVAWCQAHSARCTMGEYGIPNQPTGSASRYDQRCLVVLDTFLTNLDQNGISSAYWSAGPYGDINSVEPIDGHDRPQMAILQQHPGQ
jgi:endoglucanase